jgi:CheY-like chemotaxis protein
MLKTKIAAPMKKFYIVFFISFIILSVLLYISSWWFIAGVAVIVLITTYQFYNARLRTFTGSIEELGLQVEELQKQLDRSLVKEEKATLHAMLIREQKKALLTTISHEIRTPMNAVLSMSMLLRDTSLTKEQTEYIDTIKKSGDSLLTTIDQILLNDIIEYSKLDHKNKKTEIIDFDLRDTVEEVVNMFVITASKKNVELLVDIDDNVPSQLSGDNMRLREILMNLIENAVKFIQHGQVLVCVRLLNKNDEDPVIRFEINDSGPGMTGEQIKQLFYSSPYRGFERIKKTSRGLLVCSRHAKLMNGKMDVTSSPGSGSTFFFTAPFPKGKKTFMQSASVSAPNITEGKKILIIDDNMDSSNIISKQLRSWKMTVTTANSAMQAIEILETNRDFDLILVDLNMPQMDGLQFSRTAKKSYPGIPIILLNSAWNESYGHDQDLFAGIFIKPLRQKILRDSLFAFFDQSSKEQKNEPGTVKNVFASSFPLKILVAEDNLVNQKIAIKILGKLGYNIRMANNGKEAVEIISNEQFDIILMDVQMPEMDGLEATKNIRTQIQVQPIIIALTANVLQGDHDACIQAGMNDYMSKPIDIEDLKSKLKKWFTVSAG